MQAHQNITTTGTPIQVWQVPLNQTATVTIRLVNRTSGNVKIRLALSDSNSLDDSYWAQYDHIIYPNDSYTEAGVVLNSQDYIFVQTDTSGVTALVWGFSQ